MNFNSAADVAAHFDVPRETMDKLKAYVDLTLKWTPKINLIGKSTIPHIWSRHIADSLQIVELADENTKTWMDIGSGAGFPGLVAAIVLEKKNPECRVTLVDSDVRKCLFLRTVVRELGLNVDVISERIQNLETSPSEVLSARALAPLGDLLTMVEGLLSPKGVCLFLKGGDVDSELTAASGSWKMTTEQIPSATDPNGVILRIGDLARV